MIQSMTGFGSASCKVDGAEYSAEIRCFNNRYFKATIKLPEVFQRFESELDKQLRAGLARGSVIYSLRVRDDSAAAGYEINRAALEHYARTLMQVAAGQPGLQVDLASLLEVPGVCDAAAMDEDLLKARFAVVERLTSESIEKLCRMRRAEGVALLRDLQSQATEIRQHLAEVQERCPLVVEEFQRKFHARVQQLLAGASLPLDHDSIVREVAVFAERCDVNEEVSRLSSHLEQFDDLCGTGEDAGRKLEFLTQEMLREANTIGSKANDAVIARHVVALKTAIDRIKEQVQNVA